MIKNIIINFPTNLGDAIMGLPVLDRLKFNYPQSKITAIASPQTKDFLLKNNFIDEVAVFNKFWKFRQKARFALDLRGKYDLIVDLKNSFLPVILGAKKRTSFARKFPENTRVKDRYLSLVDKFAPKKEAPGSSFSLTAEEKSKWEALGLKKSIFVACSSLSRLKRYPYENLKEVAKALNGRYRLIFLGLEEDRRVYGDILAMANVVDLTGKTQMNEVFYLLKNYASLLLCVDSSVMHAGSYLNIPIVALFGPTKVGQYGPWAKNSMVLQRNNLSCAPCSAAECGTEIECMNIEPEKVVAAVREMVTRNT